MTTIVTLGLDAVSQAAFDRLREAHYPPHLNRIAAHLTLFHALPNAEEIHATLAETAQSIERFDMQVSRLMSLGRGVAYTISSPALMQLHGALSQAFFPHLIPQDRQKFRPHIVVQNKATPDQARILHAQLSASFAPWTICAECLEWWNYLGGPWELRERFPFASTPT